MTSILDQFEQASIRTKNNSLSVDLDTLGYLSMTLEDDVPIFTKTMKNFAPTHKITHAVIENKYLIAALTNNTILRMYLQPPASRDEISLSKFTATHKLTNLFLDPTGFHLLITLTPLAQEGSSELFYVSRKSNKLKATTKFRGHKITAVAWNNFNNFETSTGPILLGTSKGLIFETEIVQDGDKFFPSGFSSIEQYCRQVFDIGKGSNTPITSLEYFEIPASNRLVIFAATPNKLYYFTGKSDQDDKPTFQQVFNRYLNIPESQIYIQVDSSLTYSKLKFYSDNLSTPNFFAWMTGKGIMYGKLDFNSVESLEKIKSNTKTIQFPKPLYDDYSVSQKFAIAIALTKFHILLAYNDMVKGICLLNDEVVYEDNYNETSCKLVNIVKDSQTGDIWVVAETAIFQYKVTREERNVWQIFANNKQFDLAKKYSRGNEVFYNQVILKEADVLFDEQKYEESAQIYAEAESNFEEICLKFIRVNQQEALKIFLMRKLDTLKPQDQTQITMIVVWLVELYLDKLEEKRIAGLEQTTAYADIQKEFETFLALSDVSKCVKNNKGTIYELMASHGDKANLMKLTIVNKDFEQLIRQHIYKNSFYEALEVLKSQNNYEFYYNYTPILIREIPKHTVKALIENGRKLSPVRLLPALVSCEGEHHSKEVIKYLEYVIDKQKNTNKSLHNLLISLYADYEPSKLLNYLDSQGNELSLVNFDVHFALRLCQEKNLTNACVHLSSLLNLWEIAVDLALKVNIDLAKEIANKPPEEETELRKKLWLKIAHYVVSENNDVGKAMEFLHQCDLLRIEDILPYFSNFVTIEHFREAICDSLKKYNQHIQDIKEEMEEATKSAELVREDIQTFRNKCTYITSNDNCDICSVMILARPFYTFPCQHKFHSDCLREELEPLLGTGKRSKLAELDKRLVTLTRVDNVSMSSSGMSNIDMCRAEIDNILASECLYCGENMIQNIDKPFLDELEHERMKKEWE